MPVVGVAGETSGTHQQALLVRNGHTDFDAERVGLSGFSFADGCIQPLARAARRVCSCPCAVGCESALVKVLEACKVLPVDVLGKAPDLHR